MSRRIDHEHKLSPGIDKNYFTAKNSNWSSFPRIGTSKIFLNLSNIVSVDNAFLMFLNFLVN